MERELVATRRSRLEMHRMHDMHLLSGEGLSGVYDDVNECNTKNAKGIFI